MLKLRAPALRPAPVAQLDRAPDYESGGREFESLRARHFDSDSLHFRRSRWICKTKPEHFNHMPPKEENHVAKYHVSADHK